MQSFLKELREAQLKAKRAGFLETADALAKLIEAEEANEQNSQAIKNDQKS